MCREAGIRSPEFEEISNSAVVTFFVNVLVPQAIKVPSEAESKAEALEHQA